ncbi:dipeptide ABC transporter ATP-binding protein [Rhizobium sp. CCGE532]|uniref:ABC transporter ATP-binding protein n=1 Tax=Rhizobium sp. CCGE532 TaxID=2364272 RepID=UPI000EA96B2E|nr:dipeptide ABC transporter ATP-binding protein [Rhizobium sp. CCGE532]AYG76821.1 dipeptide ABC transporter ATP-binding protein [Rhizobium sp. CCGE532]
MQLGDVVSHQTPLSSSEATPLVEVKGLVKYFPTKKGGLISRSQAFVNAVDDISFDIGRGETLGLVGESGCGKSTTSRLLVRLLDPTGGTIRFDGEDIASLSGGALRRRRRDFQIIFQDPYSSLNPRMRVNDLLSEPMEIAGVASSDRESRVAELLDMVGLARQHAERFPHEFSGGQRQRIGIARALALKPKFVVCDEPVSALDVSVQAQIVNLLMDLQNELGLTYLFVAHDLSVVRHISNRVAVMYLGKIVEIASRSSIFSNPQHPYTQALISSVPAARPRTARIMVPLNGEVPSPTSPPSGCRFHTRCPMAISRCLTEEPALREISMHSVACHLA